VQAVSLLPADGPRPRVLVVTDYAYPAGGIEQSIVEIALALHDEAEFELLGDLHQYSRVEYPGDPALRARIKSYELAFRMQAEAPDAFDIRKENPQTQARYGDTEIGRSCLLARRLIERGVRMVQVYHTQTAKRSSCQLWDQHSGLRTGLREKRQARDKVEAKQRQAKAASSFYL
jgi:hypothetical protein